MELFRLSISKGFFDTDSNFMLDLLLFEKGLLYIKQFIPETTLFISEIETNTFRKL